MASDQTTVNRSSPTETGSPPGATGSSSPFRGEIDYPKVRRLDLGPVLDLLGWRADSQKNGEHRGHCPIHGSTAGKRGTFVANLEKGWWYCHKCKDGGNALDLYVEAKKLPVREAALHLCKELGIPVPRKRRGTEKRSPSPPGREPVDPKCNGQVGGEDLEDEDFGALASDLEELPIEWFLLPWIPKGMVTVVVGEPGVGKSTFEAHLCSLACRSIIFPGEEDVQRMTKPRLRVNGVKQDTVRTIWPGPRWLIPGCEKRLIAAIKRHKADLVIFDPIDDYVGEEGFNDNDPVAVRKVLQALRRVAEATGVAIVLCRHPGKDPKNVMVGSRVWGALPRSIVELLKDPGPPARLIIRHYKDSLGQEADARYYSLDGEKGKPKRWEFGEAVDSATLAVAKEERDRINRLVLDQGKDFLRGFVPADGVDSRTIRKAAELEGLSWRTVQMAKDALGMPHKWKDKGESRRCFWFPPPGGWGAGTS
jgi:hypothetical protein